MASKNISFDTISSSRRKPLAYAEFNTKLALRGLPANLLPTIIIAPRLAAGTLAANVMTSVFSDSEAATLAGIGSVAHQMVTAALKANRYLNLSLVLVDDAVGAQAATGACTLAGTPTASGTLRVKVGSTSFELPVLTSSTATTLAADVVTAIGQRPELGVTAASAAGVVTFTAKGKGTLGNKIKIVVTTTATGLTASAITMTGGATDPDITNALTSVFLAGYKIIATAFDDVANLPRLKSHVDTVSNSTEIRGAVVWFGSNGTVGTAITAASALNSGRMYQGLLRGSASNPWEIGAALAAVDAGEEDPAKILNTLALSGIEAPAVADWLSRSEQESLLYSGVTPLEVGPASAVKIVRAISTYTLSAANAPDISLLDRTTIKTLDYFRETVVNDQKIRFAREKITNRSVRQIRERAIELAYRMEDIEILRNIKQFEADFICEIDAQNPNQVNIKIPSPVVPGLHILASRFDLYLSL